MCCKSFWKKVVPFILAFMLSSYVVNFAEQLNFVTNNQEENVSQTTKYSEKIVYPKKGFLSGTGQSSASQSKEIICFACNDGKFKSPDKYKPTKELGSKVEKARILAKPKANYTDLARQNQIQGKIILRATLSADGEIINIIPVISLPFGLTEQAIVAAKQIKFKPAVRNGTQISQTVVLEYNFNIY